MTTDSISLFFNCMCLVLSLFFIWSSALIILGLVKMPKKHPRAKKKLKFVALVCARNEETVIDKPVRSMLLSKYPADRREVIVLADNCEDATAERARQAGATVWEKTVPSTGKGDVLAWGIEKLVARGDFDAIAVFDADNIVSDEWFDAMNDALQDGEVIATGRRHSSNARANSISGWYTIYWDVMNELSNRVRTNLWFSGKLTGTGFAFLPSVLGPEGYKTSTMVEDVEFTVQSNIRGYRVGYVQTADYADEQPVAVAYMWRQLRRWATGNWQVSRRYFIPWIKALIENPSIRLFDSYFAIMTGMAGSFIFLFNLLSLIISYATGNATDATYLFFFFILFFLTVMGWFAAWAAVILSPLKRRPRAIAIFSFPVFSLVLCASVIYTLFFPTRKWKKIPHGDK